MTTACSAVEFGWCWVPGWLKVPYEQQVYGHGQVADSAKKDGYGYDPSDGPVQLTGKKSLPVLEGERVPPPDGVKGLPSPWEIAPMPQELRREIAVSLQRLGGPISMSGSVVAGRWLPSCIALEL
ncbi:unnamed protein product [Prorocentrum cordatum]|uniref:Uncharacterized protein n=1 Tax=Prorocentrum cordatum TaxID=2364126 RepID=A0ABN9WDW1_9DINO|nr:unnamed protein product [Polarella glacialis]